MPIGDGTYSICMQCTSKESGQIFAVKIMNLTHDASQEIEALQKCQDHCNVVQLIEHLQDSTFKYIVFELLSGGELFSRIRDQKLFSEQLARRYFREIVGAVEFMHEQGIVHRDLKPENIMFATTEEFATLKIVDFGFARRKTSEETPPCFTLDYAAPESLTKGTTKESRDMWSLGVILYSMLIGHTPFMPQHINKQQDEQNYRKSLTENIRQGNFNKSTEQWRHISKGAKDLIGHLLQVKESERFDLHDLLSHKWMVERESEESRVTELPAVLKSNKFEETITIDDDSMDEPTKENQDERNSSNDSNSSGIVLSDRNEGLSLSSHAEENDMIPSENNKADSFEEQEVPKFIAALPEPEIADSPDSKLEKVNSPNHFESISSVIDDVDGDDNDDDNLPKETDADEEQFDLSKTSQVDDLFGFENADIIDIGLWRALSLQEPSAFEEIANPVAYPEEEDIVPQFVIEIQKPKRPRGRPPKAKAEPTEVTHVIVTESLIVRHVPKAKRGRKKKPLVQLIDVPDEVEVQKPVELKRPGRKRKHSEIDQVEFPAPVGRPIKKSRKPKAAVEIYMDQDTTRTLRTRHPIVITQTVLKVQKAQKPIIEFLPIHEPEALTTIETVIAQPRPRGRPKKAIAVKQETVKQSVIEVTNQQPPKKRQRKNVVIEHNDGYQPHIFERRVYLREPPSPQLSFFEYRAKMLQNLL